MVSASLIFAGFLLLGGRAADLMSRRAVFSFGFVLFAVASLVGGLTPDGLTLVLARGVQGLGAAVLAPATLSILTGTFSEPGERDRALGAWGATGVSGGALGMLAGGLLTQWAGWRWVLFINVPIGVVAVLGAIRFIPSDRPAARTRRSLDVPGAVLVSAGLTALVYGIVETDAYGWGAARTVLPMIAGAAILALFVVIELQFAADPLVPLRVFRRRQLATANAAVFLLGFAMLSMWYFVTLYLQQILGYTPIQAGLAFLPMSVVMAVCSRVSGSLMQRFGAGWVLTAGMACAAAGMLLFARMPANGRFATDVLPATLVTAVGLGLAFGAGTAAATADATTGEAGLAAGLANTSRQVGGSLGLAILATIAAGTNFHHSFVVSGAIAGAGAALAATLIPHNRVRRGGTVHIGHLPPIGILGCMSEAGYRPASLIALAWSISAMCSSAQARSAASGSSSDKPRSVSR